LQPRLDLDARQLEARMNELEKMAQRAAQRGK
jgi:hypothetical protein